MAKPKQSKPKHYLLATLDDVRMLSEACQLHPTEISSNKPNLKVVISATNNMGANVIFDDDDTPILIVNFAMAVEAKTAEGELICTATFDYRGRFIIDKTSTIDLTIKLPEEIIEPYIIHVGWYSTERAEQTLSIMGLRGVALPRPKAGIMTQAEEIPE